MPKLQMTHEINCDTETFWKIFLDQKFNEQLFREGLEFPEYSIVDQKETDKEVRRTVKAKPKMTMPGPVAKLLGDSFRYSEEGWLDKATKVWKFKTTPSTLADKMKNEGTMRIEAAGEGKVKRITEILIEAKVFGIGGMLEGTAEKAMKDGWDKSAVFMNKWIADKKHE